MRLIDADALLQALEIEIHKKYPFSLKDLITNAPTVEQGEPVAVCTVKPLQGNESIQSYEIKWMNGNPIEGWLYTAQPPKQWVGLSNEQIKLFAKDIYDIDIVVNGNLMNFARDIEAKLKELNYAI